MQADQTVLILRSGGGTRSGNRVFSFQRAFRFLGSELRSSPAASHWSSRCQLRLRIIFLNQTTVTGAIILLNSSLQQRRGPRRLQETKFDGWFDSRQQNVNQYSKHEQQISQISRAQNSSNQGAAPAPIKAKVPWSTRRGCLSKKDHLLKTIKGILNKLALEKFNILKGQGHDQLINSGITTADILKGIYMLNLNENLPPFSSDEPRGKEITFKGVLVNNCQEVFEGADKLREELQQMAAPNQESDRRDRFMVRDVLDLRAHNWVPRREEVKAKTINVIHSEAEKNMGLRPGGMMPRGRNMPGMPGMDNDNGEVPRSRSLPKGMLLTFIPGMVSLLLLQSRLQEAPASPVGYASKPEPQVAPSRQPPASSVTPVTEKPLLLEEYTSVSDFWMRLKLQFVEELKSPAYHPEVVKEAISLWLEKSPPCVKPIGKLVEYLFVKKVLDLKDVVTGFLLYAASLDDLTIDLPKVPANFGEIIGILVVAGCLYFKVVRDILAKAELLDSQASDVTVCESVF
ncbi:eukaryotic translation initiation factor [Salvia divinorum]|uniref:Eukaryotic translation initiation factor n=1 Tax=Salvia divinorum TaxID=28513 RepID=A0ABD1FGU1_SALDI